MSTLPADGHDVIIVNGCGPGFGGGGDGEPITGPLDSGTVVKYTEANGKTPGWKYMAGNTGGQGGANADYVYIHVWGQGDMGVCDAVDTSVCTCCYVPPPPFPGPIVE